MSDVNRRKTAGWLTDEAKRLVTTDRAYQHGNAEESFQMIADLWAVYLEHTNKAWHGSQRAVIITPQDVAEMMSLLKKARKVYGSGGADNYIDDIGYTALGGSMIVHDIIKEEAHKAVAAVQEPDYISKEEVERINKLQTEQQQARYNKDGKTWNPLGDRAQNNAKRS